MDIGARGQLVGARPARHEPVPRGIGTRSGPATVVLVGDVADDLLNGVLEGDNARGPAVLIDDDGHLRALIAQLDQQARQGHGLGHARSRRHEGGGGHWHARPPLVGHGDDAAQVDDAQDVVGVVPDDGEAGVAGGAGQGHDGVGGVRLIQDVKAAPVRHDVDRGECAEPDRPGEQGGGGGIESALLGTVAHEGGELTGAAGAADLLDRFDAHAMQDQVGGVIEQDDDGPEHNGKGHEEGGDEPGGAHGIGQGGVLGDELAHDHGEGVDHHQGDDDGGSGGRGLGQPGAHEAVEEPRQGVLHGVSEQDRGQSDADLSAGQEGGQAPQRLADRGGAPVPRGGTGLDGGGIQSDQGELAGDEQGRARGQQDPQGDHEPVGRVGHAAPPEAGVGFRAGFRQTRGVPAAAVAGTR